MVQIKRKRTVYSCENCRLKKIKCNRERPCSRCIKEGLKCLYISSNSFDGAGGIEKKLEALRKDLQFLERKKSNLDADKVDSEVVRFNQALVLLTLIKKNKYLAAVVKSIDETKTPVPPAVKQQVENRPKETDVLKFKLVQLGMEKFLSIKPYLSEAQTVRQYVDHFFTSELYASSPYVDKDTLYSFLDSCYDGDSLNLTVDKIQKKDYQSIGVLLCIMRISYLSYYTIGKKEHVPLFVGVEAANLAALCVEELIFPSFYLNTGIVELLLLLDFCHRNSSELDGWMFKSSKSSSYNITQTAVTISLNIDPPSSDESGNLKRKLWHSLIYYSYQDAIYNGYPSFIGREEYTTQVPLLTEDDEYENLISHVFHYRESLPEMLAPLTKMFTNERSPPTIREYELYADSILVKIENNPLAEILSDDSSTKYSRTLKAAKFIDSLSMHCLSYMIYSRILLTCDKDGEQNSKLFKKSLKSIVKLSNPILGLCYFADTQRQDKYNTKSHFGHNIEIIPLILHNLHRVLEAQYTLLAKVGYQSLTDYDPRLQKIRDMVAQNVLMIITTFGNLSEGYSYARKLYLIHSYFTPLVFGRDGLSISTDYIRLISDGEKVQIIDDELKEYLLHNLITVEGQPRLNPDSFEPEPPVGSLSSILNTPHDLISPDPLIIEKLERFLESQSFLS